MMKKIVFVSVIIIIGNIQIFAQKLSSWDGWEFFVWGTEKISVEETLQRKGLDIESNKIYTAFKYEDLSTVIYYDHNGLKEVNQTMSFSITQKKEADEFTPQLLKKLETKYGKPTIENDYPEKGEKRIIWITDHTQVILYYNYDQRIVDELGAGSYAYRIVYLPI